MEQILQTAKSIYFQHTAELIFALLGCILVLMIINMMAVRRCKRQVCSLQDKTRDMVKLVLRQSETTAKKPRDRQEESGEWTERRERGSSREEEEVFGSVIQEIFS